ncbi:hypothetical protein [Alcanivorax jadensis]|uniref:hypothetical protein n=1 Tax=Alcanivorax jadensis TaxID=64988 RepID=UPI002353C74C|nr:hypothetical protein [Alcanivorax jadensis]
MLEQFRGLNASVADLYEKRGVDRQDVVRIQEQLKAVHRQLGSLEKGHDRLMDGDTDRKVDKGTNALKWALVGVLATAIVVAIATGIVNMTMESWNRNEGDGNEIQRTGSTGE